MDQMQTEGSASLIKAGAALTSSARSRTPGDDTDNQIEAFTDDETGATTVETVAASELRALIERIERLEEEKASIQGDIKDVFGEAKGRGYDTTAIRMIIRLRKKDANERLEEESILQTYMAALGME